MRRLTRRKRAIQFSMFNAPRDGLPAERIDSSAPASRGRSVRGNDEPLILRPADPATPLRPQEVSRRSGEVGWRSASSQPRQQPWSRLCRPAEPPDIENRSTRRAGFVGDCAGRAPAVKPPAAASLAFARDCRLSATRDPPTNKPADQRAAIHLTARPRRPFAPLDTRTTRPGRPGT